MPTPDLTRLNPVPSPKRRTFVVAEGIEYKATPLHFRIPHGVYLHEAACVAVNSKGHVYCFNRGTMPLMIFDSQGNLLNADSWNGTADLYGGYDAAESKADGVVRWRGSEFVKPHGITIDEADNLWLVDVKAHVVTHCTPDGRRLMMLLPGPRAVRDEATMRTLIGKAQTPSDLQSGVAFNLPCNVAVQPRPDGFVYVCDGYGNSRVHCFRRSDGGHVRSWGRSGTASGQFNLPHDLVVLHRPEQSDPEGDRVLVADRENHRIQIFSASGQYLAQWHVHRPCGIALSWDRRLLYVCQLAPSHSSQRTGGQAHPEKWTSNIGNCVTIHDPVSGTRYGRIGQPHGTDSPLGMLEPHGIAVDGGGVVYTASVSFHREGIYRKPVPYILATLKRWVPG